MLKMALWRLWLVSESEKVLRCALAGPLLRSKMARGCFSPQLVGSFPADRDTGDEDREYRGDVALMQPLSTAFRTP